jgi:DNA-binding SARP family transcriptional activator
VAARLVVSPFTLKTSSPTGTSDQGMALYHLRTLGGLVLSRNDEPSNEIALADSKALLLLAFLATKPGYTARRVDIAELFWREGDRARSLRALRQALFFLSQHANEVLLRDDDSVTLNADALTVDLWEFDRAVERGDHARVIELHAGRFAAGLERKVGAELEHWIESVDARITVAIEVAYSRETSRALAEGEAGRAATLAAAFAALNPLDEARQELLACSLMAAGDPVAALQALEVYRKVATPMLGEASPELDARIDAMRQKLLKVESGSAARARAEPPQAAAERSSRPVFVIRGHRVTRTMLIVAGAVLVSVTAAASLLSRGRGPAVDPFADLDGRLLAVVERGSQDKVAELAIRRTGIMVSDRNDLQPTDLPSPDGGTVATMVQAPDGWNLAARTASGEPHVLTTAPGDEYPLAWSPDGRFLVYGHRRLLADGRTESNDIAVYDLQADSGAALAALSSHERPTAAWSPGGTRIAFTADVAGVPDVFVVRFDGTGLRDVSHNPAWDGEPAWSPDEQRVAFISRRSGEADLYVARSDGSDLRRLTQSRWGKHRPIWVSPVTLAFAAERDGKQSVEVVNAFTGQARDLGGPDGLVAILETRQAPPPWIARVAIVPRTSVGSPGERLAYRVDVRTSADSPLVAEGLPVDWRVTDGRVAVLDGAGRVRVVGAGRADIIASAAGWRADTLTLFSMPLVTRPATPVFAERWTSAPDTSRWRLFGEPLPTTSRSGGPRRSGVFHNNGDQFFASGAVTTAAFPLEKGISVVVDGRAAFSGKAHQEFGVALYPNDYADSVLASGQAPALAEFRMRGPSGADSGEASIATPAWREAIPMPSNPGAWHAYCLQVLGDGTVELIVNDSLYWRSPTPLDHLPTAVHVALGFQSFEGAIEHGPVRVYAQPRFELPQVTVPGGHEKKEPGRP